MHDFSTLTTEPCPLMTDEILNMHNSLAEQLSRVRDELPAAWAREPVQKIIREYGEVRERLIRKRYFVGFIGRSAVGKSTTFNNVLGVQGDQVPALVGGGGATTSAITRLRRVPPDSKADCWVHYLTPEQHVKRCDSLLKAAGLDGMSLPEALPRLNQLLEPGHTGASNEVLKTDLEYLKRYIESYQLYGSEYVNVESPPRSEEVDYDQRHSFAAHATDENISSFPLVRELKIGFPTEAISEQLEMIDLPGLNGKVRIDDLLTKDFLDDLDGALVFLEASGQAAPREFYSICHRLREIFQADLTGRVWVVITKFDGLSKIHVDGDARDGLTLLDHVAVALKENDIPQNQTICVSNKIFDLCRQADGTMHPPAEHVFTDQLSLEVLDGKPLTPEKFKKHEGLCNAFQRVFEGGGIGALREVIQETIAQRVEQRVRADVTQRLRKLAGEMAEQLEITRQRLGQTSEDYRNALQWVAATQQIHQIVSEKRGFLETHAKELHEKLQTEFESYCPTNLRIGAEELRASHSRYAKALVSIASETLRDDVVPGLYKATKDCFSERLIPVRVLKYADPILAWEAVAKEESANEMPYRLVIDSLTSPDLFPVQENGDSESTAKPEKILTDNDYRQLMTTKIQVIVQQVMHSLGRRIGERLKGLEKALHWIGEEDGSADKERKEITKQQSALYSQASNELRKLGI